MPFLLKGHIVELSRRRFRYAGIDYRRIASSLEQRETNLIQIADGGLGRAMESTRNFGHDLTQVTGDIKQDKSRSLHASFIELGTPECVYGR